MKSKALNSKIKIFTDISEIMTLRGAYKKKARNIEDKDLGVVKNAALVVEGSKVKWVGPQGRLPARWLGGTTHSLNGQNIFPGFVESHTHLLFAGNRQDEFERRNRGVSYQQIASEGGGIAATVRATRKASQKVLQGLGDQRVNCFLRQGVTTLEVKSGYGLNRPSEMRMLAVAKQLKKVRVVGTFLGAHSIPSEFSNEQDYIEELLKWLPVIARKNLADRVDIFIEENYFSLKVAKAYLETAKKIGFGLTLHGDQLSSQGACVLGVALGAQSVDHAICLSKKEKRILAASETTAVLLPSADFYLHCAYPDARSLLDSGGRCALASDFNPGSSPTQSLALVGLLARLKMKMSLAEVFVGLTLSGAFALGGAEKYGSLVPGMSADFFCSPWSWKNFFFDGMGFPVSSVWVKGSRVFKQ